MILWYALGGGFGHISRTWALIHQLALDKKQVTVLVSPENRDFWDEDLQLLEIPKSHESKVLAREFIKDLLATEEFNEVYIDTFPSGILGELDESLLCDYPVTLIQRKLAKEYFDKFDDSMRFDRIIEVEPALADQPKLECTTREKIEIDFPLLETNPQLESKIGKLARPWLVLHSGPQEEVESLVNHALDLTAMENETSDIVVSSFCQISHSRVSSITLSPAYLYLNLFERVICAAGYNTITQLANYQGEIDIVPFERRYDDQFARAKQFKSARAAI